MDLKKEPTCISFPEVDAFYVDQAIVYAHSPEFTRVFSEII